jgi:hypothetical protein
MNDLCPYCDEPLEDGSVIISSLDGPLRYHCECAIRQIVGGLNHLQGRCTCCGGKEPPDPPEMTRREAARAACLAYWKVTPQPSPEL